MERIGESIDFETLYHSFITNLRECCTEKIVKKRIANFVTISPSGEWRWKPQSPCTVVSLFEHGCIEKGLSYFEGGPMYNLFSPHIGGLADIANSLYAIQKLVYEENKITLPCHDIYSTQIYGTFPLVHQGFVVQTCVLQAERRSAQPHLHNSV